MSKEIEAMGDDDANATISLEEYESVKIGMSYSEVKKIVGGPGNALSESGDAVVYMYNGEGSIGANANFMFLSGELVNKAQFGLE
ncbi:hypothetical protein VN24_17580 [Paenibacillus beijingensis]|uniref:Uncharacterized protein n=2 Tax=Paenibacillus beijingensis TaxID=1126833 RepID=A0A0D5NSE2_9BACL|nr:hypothetical protein VN24_17580 [Paenibacillus beijingensis]